MRTFKKILTLAGAAVILCSCEFEFDVRSDAKPGLYLQCMADQSEGQVYMRLQYAAAAQGNTGDIPDLDIKNIGITADGSTLQAVAVRDSFYVASCPSGLKPGSEISVHVEAEGLPAVNAFCQIPERISLTGMTHSVDTLMGIPMHLLTLELDRRPAAGEYLAVLLEKTTWFEGDSVKTDALSPMVNFGSSMDIETAQITFHAPFIRESRGDESKVTVIPGTGARGATLELTAADISAMIPPVMMPPGMMPEPGPAVLRTSYQAHVWSVSESFYRYSLASYKSKSDFMAMMGLAPANFAWSNVSGGFGICGAFADGGDSGVLITMDSKL